MTETTTTSSDSSSGQTSWMKYATYAAVLIGIFVAYKFLPLKEWIGSFTGWIEGFGVLGWVMYALLYAVCTLLIVPGSLLTLAAGLAFGLIGFPIVVFGATLGAGLAFLAARYLVRDRIQDKIQGNRKLKAIDDAIGDEGWKVVGLLRLSPAVPFSLQNWILGGTSVRFWPYLIASFFCIMPGTLLYVWIGSLGNQAAEGGSSLAKWILLGVGILATLVVTILISKKAKAKLEEHGLEDG